MQINPHEIKRAEIRSRHSAVASLNTVILALVVIGIGIFMFVYDQQFAPIAREKAVAYTGEFVSYESADSEQDGVISFRDGSTYYINFSCEDSAFLDAMYAMESGTPLHLLVNPKSDYVLEMRTDTAELLNFQAVQNKLRVDWIVWLGISGILWILGVTLIAFAILERVRKHRQKSEDPIASELGLATESAVLRYADPDVKCRILLEETFEEYHICYRRVKSVNELVVNGRVYDEKKGVLEFEHTLRAVIDGHLIEAGLDDMTCSFLRFDGELIGYKQRIV